MTSKSFDRIQLTTGNIKLNSLFEKIWQIAKVYSAVAWLEAVPIVLQASVFIFYFLLFLH